MACTILLFCLTLILPFSVSLPQSSLNKTSLALTENSLHHGTWLKSSALARLSLWRQISSCTLFANRRIPQQYAFPFVPITRHVLMAMLQSFQVQVRRVQVLDESAAPVTVHAPSAPVSPAKKSASGLFARLSKSVPPITLHSGDSKAAESSHASTSRTAPTDTPVSGPTPSKRVTRSK